MNQGRICCVVHPAVGLPLLLGSVTTIALIVHASVLSNTTWMAKYWQGGSEATVAQTQHHRAQHRQWKRSPRQSSRLSARASRRRSSDPPDRCSRAARTPP